MIICHQDSDQIPTISDSTFRFCEVLVVAPEGTSAIILLYQQIPQEEDVIKLFFDDSKSRIFGQGYFYSVRAEWYQSYA